jgi:preprotein translocase subunit SecG
MLHTLLMIVHFFCAAAIVALVLLQRGKGAEAGAGFGAGASGTVFGARGASTALSRATAILAAIFMVTSLTLAYVSARKPSNTGASGLLEQFSQTAPPKTTQGAPGGVITLPAPVPAGSGVPAIAPPDAPPASLTLPATQTPQPTTAQPTTPSAPSAAPAAPSNSPPPK